MKELAIKTNVLASIGSQVYVSAISVLVLPLYLRELGPDAYGLIGFYMAMQAWLALLDFGLTPTVSRASALARTKKCKSISIWSLISIFERILLLIATTLGIAAFITSKYLSIHWFLEAQLLNQEIQKSLELMVIAISLRLIANLHRGIISGFERIIWLGLWNSTIATLRFLIVIPMLSEMKLSISLFFAFQTMVSLIDLIVVKRFTSRLLTTYARGSQSSPIDITPSLRFAFSMALTNSTWIIATQTDKLILAGIISLSDYGYFTFAATTASGIQLLSAAIFSAVLPRFVTLYSAGGIERSLPLYRSVSQLITLSAGTLSAFIAIFTPEILYAWTADSSVVQQVNPSLSKYAIGYGIMSISSLPYLLQNASGSIKLHLIGTVLFIAVLTPGTIVGAELYGSIGASYSWLIANALYALLWIPLVHRRFDRTLHISWLAKDILAPIIPAIACGLTLHMLLPLPSERGPLILALFGILLIMSLAGVTCSTALRKYFTPKMQ